MIGDCECGEPCCHKNYDGPCWGPIVAVDEQYDDDGHWFVHACTGHASIVHGGKYTPQK